MQQALAGQLPLVMHFKLLAQYWDVLTRPEHRARLIYTSAQIECILAALVGVAAGKNIMPKTSTFLLRLPETERERARKLAAALGYSENRLYAELIHEGLLMHEQMAYMAQLRAMHVSPTEGLALLALAPDVEPDPEDRLPEEESER
jgi:hypothetical protein